MPGIDVRALRRFRNRAAPQFDTTSALAREVGARMAARLDLVKLPAGPLLDLGCGMGAGVEALRARFAHVPVLGLEPAEALLRQAASARPVRRSWWRRAGGSPCRFVCADLDQLPFRPGTFAMVWSNLAAQWFRDPPSVWRQIGVTLRPGGLLAFSVFGPDTLRELRSAWRESGRPAPILPFADMHDVGDALVQAGFADPVMDVDLLTLTYPDISGLVADLRGQGAQNVLAGRPAGLFAPSAWRRVRDRYDASARNGRVEATFEIVYGHAWWPEEGPKQTAAGEPIVRFRGRNPR